MLSQYNWTKVETFTLRQYLNITLTNNRAFNTRNVKYFYATGLTWTGSIPKTWNKRCAEIAHPQQTLHKYCLRFFQQACKQSHINITWIVNSHGFHGEILKREMVRTEPSFSTLKTNLQTNQQQREDIKI